MRLIAWLLTIVFGLAGLAFREQGGIVHAREVGTALLVLAGMSCPLFWGRDHALLLWSGLRAKDRLMLGLAMILAVPLAFPWPFWK